MTLVLAFSYLLVPPSETLRPGRNLAAGSVGEKAIQRTLSHEDESSIAALDPMACTARLCEADEEDDASEPDQCTRGRARHDGARGHCRAFILRRRGR